MALLKGTLFTLCIIFSSLICCFSREEELRRLNLGETQVQIIGDCCPVDEGRQCTFSRCPVASAASITDGSALTEWLVNFTSTGTGDAQPRVFFIFDFEQPYRFHSVTLLSTSRPLPQEWNVTVSSAATSQSVATTNDGVFEQTVILGREEEPILSSKLQVTIFLPTTDNPEPIAISELIAAISDSTLPEDIGCGVCVERLNDTLDDLIAGLQNASVTLDSLVNQTQIRLLSEAIANIQFATGGYEDFLRVLAVVLGVTPPLDDNVTLAERVPRLDLELVPPIPGKLDILEQVLNRTSILEFDLVDLKGDLDELLVNLLNIHAVYDRLFSNVTAFRSSFVDLIDTLDRHINVTGETIVEVRTIHEFISGTNFSQERDNLDMYNSRVKEAGNFSVVLETAINFTYEQVLESNTSVLRVYDLLGDALEIINEVAEESESALQTVVTVDSLIELIKILLLEGELLNSSISSSVTTINSNLDTYLQVIRSINSSLQLIRDLHSDLRLLIERLRAQVNSYEDSLSPYRLPQSCNLSLPCAEFEVYADTLFMNASKIVNSSVTRFTLQRVRDFLDSILERGQLFDYSLINETATLAFETAGQALGLANNLSVGALIDEVSLISTSIKMLQEDSAILNNTVYDLVSRAEGLQRDYLNLSMLLKEQQDTAAMLQNSTDILRQSTGLAVEARELLLLAEEANNRSVVAENKVTTAEDALEGVASDITQTRVNVKEAADELNAAESKFESIALLLNRTRDKASEFLFNTTSFIEENERLIGEINDIIDGLADIHSRLNRINSPIELATEGPNMPYLSLQPPPGRIIDNAIQFESLELFFATSAAFTTPSVIFYAGPVYESETDVLIAGNMSMEDYFLLTVEANGQLQLLWSMGDMSGMLSTPFSSGFENWIVVTRHGSMFQLRYGTSSLPQGMRGGVNANGTVLFRVSERTAFLVGGWPRGAQLGVPSSVVNVQQYSTLQGQFQLVLFNGEQWGLWNIRGSSDTNFIGQFHRSSLVSTNVWESSSTELSPSVAFDGSGYLFVDPLSDVSGQVSGFSTNIRPRDGRDALILYAYDETLMISVEFAYINGKVQTRIYRHDINMSVLDYTSEDSAPVNSAQFLFLGNRFIVGTDPPVQIGPNGNERFFNNLRNVKAWIGGVRMDLLQQPFVPQLSNGSYYGCMGITRILRSRVSLFRRDSFFISTYLGSPVQKGFSGTCLITTYASEAGFSGATDSYLSFTFLLLHKPVTDGTVYRSTRDGRSVISFSMFPNQAKGVLLVALGQLSSTVVIYFLNGILLVEIQNQSGRTQLRSTMDVSVQEWHQVLLEMTSTFTLYFDGIIQDQKEALTDFILDVAVVSSGSDEVLFVGGASASALPQSVTISDLQFEGCIKDLAFNFNAMDLFSNALAAGRRNLAGITYHTCPFFEAPVAPLLAVHPVIPQERVCLSSALAEVPNTHGAFHKSASLITGNVIGLLNSSWTFSLLLRQLDDGHVMTIMSTDGHIVRLLVRNGTAQLTLYGEGIFEEAQRLPLPNGVFTPVVISCEVESVDESLSCSLTVDGSLGERVQVPYTAGSIFFPSLPIFFGALSVSVTDAVTIESFVGCIQGLAINGDSRGFREVTTGLSCFNGTRAGQGFSGISRIGIQLPQLSTTPRTVQFQFQPQLDNGLLLLLSDSNGTSPALAVGIFNGELRVSDLSTSGQSGVQDLGSVCDPSTPVTYNFSLQYNSTHAEVSVRSGEDQENRTILPFTMGNQPLLLTIGNIPSELVVPETSSIFGFLLNDNRLQGNIPPGFTGCINNIAVDGRQFSNYYDVEEVLEGYCPAV